MELRCPQCGKWMAVSQEELVMHDCQVVCPQCLAICQYEGGELVVRDDSDAPYRHTASASTSAPQHETSRFCHSCGKQLPGGISFCPYCGADLSAPFSDTPQPAAAPAASSEPPAPRPAPKPAPVKEKSSPAPVEPTPSRQGNAPSRVEDNLRTITRHYSSAHPHLHQNGTMPGKTFKIVAYAIIVALLVLLAYIIIAGNSIEPAM